MNYQNLSHLFYLKVSKKTSDDRIPLYIHITIDGIVEEISPGQKVLEDDWDLKHKYRPGYG